MKQILPLLLVLPGLLFAEPPVVRVFPHSAAQETAAPKAALPENYQITLTLTGWDSSPLEVCMVVVPPAFRANLEEHGFEFSGTFDPADGTTVVASYHLAWWNAKGSDTTPPGIRGMVGRSSTQGSVRLALGNSQVLFRAGNQTLRVSIEKLGLAKP